VSGFTICTCLVSCCCCVRFVPLVIDARGFWLKYVEARKRKALLDAQVSSDLDSPSRHRGSTASSGSVSSSAAKSSVESFETPTDFFKALVAGAFDSLGQQKFRNAKSELPRGAQNFDLLAQAEDEGCSVVRLSTSVANGGSYAGVGSGELNRAYEIDQQELALNGAGVVKVVNRYSSVVINDSDASVSVVNAAKLVPPLAATASVEDLREDLPDLCAGMDPSIGFAAMPAAFPNVGAAGTHVSQRLRWGAHSDIGDSSDIRNKVLVLPELPPCEAKTGSADTTHASMLVLQEFTRSAHDLVSAQPRRVNGFPEVVPRQWCDWVEMRFKLHRELLPHLWASVTSSVLSTTVASAERVERISRRILQEYDDLECVKRNVMLLGASAPVGVTDSLPTAVNMSSDIDIREDGESSLRAKNELIGLINCLQRGLDKSVVQAQAILARGTGDTSMQSVR
jgi:hypothetical protein